MLGRQVAGLGSWLGAQKPGLMKKAQNATPKRIDCRVDCHALTAPVIGTRAFLAERTRNFEVISFSNRLVLITDVMFSLTGRLLVVCTGSPHVPPQGGRTSRLAGVDRLVVHALQFVGNHLGADANTY